ncbi:MAG: hypothetical protein ACM4D3_01780 [Candidatus Sericytochromatia bacterium]
MVNVTDFHNPRPVFKFDKVGARLEGVIVDQPELQSDKFGDPGDKQLLLVVQMGDTTWRWFARRQALTAVGEGVVAADVDAIEDGGWISVVRGDDKPTGGAKPMHSFQATYLPPSELGQGVFGAEESA